jgi:group I intron endonuclease
MKKRIKFLFFFIKQKPPLNRGGKKKTITFVFATTLLKGMKNLSLIDSYMFSNIDESLLEKAGVYKITNIKNNRFYIGSTSLSFKIRFRNHLRVMKKLAHHSHKLKRDLLLYGIEKFIFEILEITKPEDAVIAEQKYMDLLHPYYNIYLYADSPRGRKCTDEQKHNLSLAKTAKFNEEELIKYYLKYGGQKTIRKFHTSKPTVDLVLLKYHIPKHKSGPSIETMMNRNKYPPEKILEMYDLGISMRNIKKESHTSFERIQEILINNGRQIIKHPPLNQNQKDALSNSLKGRFFSEQHKSNLSKARIGTKTGGDNGRARTVINLKDETIYSSIREVSQLYGIKIHLLSDRLHGRTKNDTDFIFLENQKNFC